MSPPWAMAMATVPPPPPDAILPTVEVLELTIQVTLPIFVVQGGTVYFMVYAAIPLYFIP
uniref:Uncharacterized protein n=1 Tax=Globodera pallida TaxID=36090 RepID=A0A183CU09_GLOPA